MNNRKGPLSKSERLYIRKNAQRLSIDDMAVFLKRTPKQIERFITENGNLKLVATTREEKPENESIIRTLQRKVFYKTLKSQFDLEELKFFCQQWVIIVTQLGGDILPTEELQLKEMLTVEILKSRLLKENKMLADACVRYSSLIETEMAQDKEARDRQLLAHYKAEMAQARSTIRDNLKTVREFSEKSTALNKALNTSRDQRTKDFEKSRYDFVGVLKLLQENDVRQRVGKEMELMKRARERAEEQLGNYYEYADKQLDKPLLTSETIDKND